MRTGIIVAMVLLVVAGRTYAGDGASIYKAKCQSCHGPTGAGGNPAIAKMLKIDPQLLSLKALATKSDADASKLITDGKEKMPAFGKKLSAEDVAAVLTYCRQLISSGAASAPAAQP